MLTSVKPVRMCLLLLAMTASAIALLTAQCWSMITEQCNLEHTQHFFLFVFFFFFIFFHCFTSDVSLCLPCCRATSIIYSQSSTAQGRIWEFVFQKTIWFEAKLYVRISVPCDVQTWPFMDCTTADDSIPPPSCKARRVKLSRVESGTFKLCKQCLRRPHYAVPQHIGLLRYLCVPLAALRLLRCVLMCLLCLLSLPLLPPFSCFMVSPRKKYSFRSVILTAINISSNLLFTVPSLPLQCVWSKTGGGWIEGMQWKMHVGEKKPQNKTVDALKCKPRAGSLLFPFLC